MRLKHSHGGYLPSPDELHAFEIGFFEVLCPWKQRFARSPQATKFIHREYHYYLAGRAGGFILLCLLLTGIAKLVKEVLL